MKVSGLNFNGDTQMTFTGFQKKLGLFATTLRVILSPVILLGIYIPSHESIKYLCAVVFVIASVTDWLDGYWARKYNGVTDFGKFYDPAADKILVLSAFITLLLLNLIHPFLVFLLLARDFIIGAVRAAAASKNVVISAKPLGKWKTAIQMSCIPALFLNESYFDIPFVKIATLGLWISLVLSLLSAMEYIQLFKKKVPNT